jgi:sec-independent protein translocase protein TatA
MVEWLIVLVVVAILLFVGPKKLPELARGMGRAWGEFRRGREEVERELREPRAPESAVAKAARDLGISVEGKSEEQLKREIAERMKN